MSSRIPGKVLCLVLLAVCGQTSPGQGRPMTTDELTRSADVVVVGKVAGVKGTWDGSRSRIYTTVTLNVDQTLKGNVPGGTLTLLTPGGEVGGTGELYTHSAQFRQDEDVVVFARRDRMGHFRVSGGERGKFTIKKDEATGTPLIGGRKTLDEFSREIQKAANSSGR